MKRLVFAVTLAISGLLTAQNEQKVEQLDSVLLDTKVRIPRKNSGKIITTIDAETLKNSQGQSVAQVINQVAGIEINGSRSNDGQNLGYYIRGGRNRQVLIVIDGVPVNDPSSIANDYDLRLVPAATIQNIEIMKGASSVLYGTNAATAVISITTLPASKKKISAVITSSIGTNLSAEDEDLNTDYDAEEFNNAIAISGTLGKVFYNASFNQRYVDGLSAAAAPEDATEAFEKDAFNHYEGKARLGYNFSKNVKMSQFFSFGKFKADFDNFDYTDAANRTITDQLRTGGNFTWKYSKGVYVFNDNFTWIEREIESGFPVKYDTKSYNLDNYITYEITEELTALVGLGYNKSSFESFSVPFGENDLVQDLDDTVAEFDMIDPYLNLTYISKIGFQANAGARFNIHSDYGTHIVYNVNPSYNLGLGKNNLKFLASYSTAYITPSLFQLHDPLYGNLDLEPEENSTIEGGVEFTTDNNLRISALYFTRNEKNFVDFVTIDPVNFISQYQNIGDEFEASGVEVEVSKQFGERINLRANYTNTKPDERFASRIPEHKGIATVSYSVGSKSYLGLTYQYVSERDDSFFNNETFMTDMVTLESFGTLDFMASTHLLPNMRIFLNVSNLLNEEYEEIFRFQTRGRNARVGFSLNF